MKSATPLPPWRPHEMAAFRPQLGKIAGLIARVTGKILVRRELARIDKDRDEGSVGKLGGAAHEGQVPGVQGPHGGNERDL